MNICLAKGFKKNLTFIRIYEIRTRLLNGVSYIAYKYLYDIRRTCFGEMFNSKNIY